ncbi:hypothetical protein BDN72DRAFT_860677 [Pluteus cervinus]|uniref:Uncharacterized protein n=1 Tax=Pluteus cervinus TaxID=181527 RepID=A0ACD3AIH2_9AGAR|nr:hypothetical protein BDN72DRAFT_860677 [Pluteus cervinus]
MDTPSQVGGATLYNLNSPNLLIWHRILISYASPPGYRSWRVFFPKSKKAYPLPSVELWPGLFQEVQSVRPTYNRPFVNVDVLTGVTYLCMEFKQFVMRAYVGDLNISINLPAHQDLPKMVDKWAATFCAESNILVTLSPIACQKLTRRLEIWGRLLKRTAPTIAERLAGTSDS